MDTKALAVSATALAAAFAAGDSASAKDYFLASGRWDNVVLVIDLETYEVKGRVTEVGNES